MAKRGKPKHVSHENGPSTTSSSHLSSTSSSNVKKQSGTKRSRVEMNVEVAQVRPEPSEEEQQLQWSKSKKKRMRFRIMKEKNQSDDAADKKTIDLKQLKKGSNTTNATVTATATTKIINIVQKVEHGNNDGKSKSSVVKIRSKSSSALQKSFHERLSGSRFRILNEELYTSSSTTAFQRFQQNPTLFDEYHEGFRHQVEQWPCNPVSIIVDQLTNVHHTIVSSDQSQKKVRKIVVADFGCGEAELAKQLLMIRDKRNNSKFPFVVHSFDLVAKGPNAELITACDAAHTPLTSGTVDYGIFCLALMGTNLADFIREGHRVLKPDGKLLIAEVRSRFESMKSSNGEIKHDKATRVVKSNEDSLQEFIQVLDQLGFETYHTDRSNTMFVLLSLKKNGKKPKKDLKYTAKPCIYKRR